MKKMLISFLVTSFLVILSGCSFGKNNSSDQTKLLEENASLKQQISGIMLQIDALKSENEALNNQNKILTQGTGKNNLEQDGTNQIAIQSGDDITKLFKSSKYGFTFKYPQNTSIQEKLDTSHQYVRLQNYPKDVQRSSLLSGEYYLELFVYDSEKGHKNAESCQQSVANAEIVNVGTVTGYRGYGMGGGDAGGIRFVLCIEQGSNQYYFQVTENSQQPLLAKKILDSVQFTK